MSPTFRQAPDRVHGRTLAAIGIAGIVTIVASVGVADGLLHARRQELGASGHGPVPSPAPEEIGRIDQTPIRTGTDAWDRQLASERAWRDGWGWVDPQAGTIHVPVEVAMRLMLGEEAP